MVAGGAAALLHETVWFRVLTPVLGAGALTAAAISAGTLLGLALGAAWGGRWAAASAQPLRVLAAGEGLGALLCAALLPLAPLLERVVEALGEGGLIAAGLPALLGTAACAAAALPLGLSLPAACRALVQDCRRR